MMNIKFILLARTAECGLNFLPWTLNKVECLELGINTWILNEGTKQTEYLARHDKLRGFMLTPRQSLLDQ